VKWAGGGKVGLNVQYTPEKNAESSEDDKQRTRKYSSAIENIRTAEEDE